MRKIPGFCLGLLLLAVCGGCAVTGGPHAEKPSSPALAPSPAAEGDGPLSAKTLLDQGWSQVQAGDHEAAGNTLARAMKRLDRDRDPELYALGAYAIGVLFFDRRETSKAVTSFKITEAVGLEHLGEDHPYVFAAREMMAASYDDLGRFQEAEPIFRELAEAGARVSGAGSEDHLRAMLNLAVNLNYQAKYTEALGLYEEIRPAAEKLDDGGAMEANVDMGRGDAHRGLGDYEQALDLYRSALAYLEQAGGSESKAVSMAHCSIGMAQLESGQLPEAEKTVQQAVQSLEHILPPGDPQLDHARGLLSRIHQAQAEAPGLDP